MPTACVSQMRGDLHHLGDAADVGQRRADEIDVVVLDEPVEVPLETPLFAVRQRDRRHLAQLGNVLERVFVAHRIFDEERIELLHDVADADGVVEVEALVEVDAPVAVRARRLRGRPCNPVRPSAPLSVCHRRRQSARRPAPMRKAR